MSLRALGRLLAVYAALLLVAGVAVSRGFALAALERPIVVESWWRAGARVGRVVSAPGDAKNPYPPGAEVSVVEETVTGRGPLPIHPLLFELGLVAGRDGVEARLGDKVAYATVDDLLNRELYERAHVYPEASFGWGTPVPLVMEALARDLAVSPEELTKKGTFARVRFERHTKNLTPPRRDVPDRAGGLPRAITRAWPEHIGEAEVTRDLVRDAVAEAANHLARNLDDTGTFRYLVDATTNRTIRGYNWPRHSGATFFLAQAAALLDDPYLRYAALRAAANLRDQMIKDCGANRCISGDDAITEIGSSALAVIAFTEIVRTGADASYLPAIAQLAAFLRSQQRPDGELMHLYDRGQRRPIDIQYLYFSGEAALALARAHSVSGDPRDLDAATRALRRLSGGGWSFFGSRYHYSEEHWTCQAVAELWDRVPDREALDFCSRWHEYQRRLQQEPDDSPFDGGGSFGFGPLVSPRITPASSRGEAAGALAAVLRATGQGSRKDELVLVERELRRALAFVLRNQFHPGPAHLFADPLAARGAVPGSPVDWLLRIDYPQHAGSMMIRFLEIDAQSKPN